MAVAYWALRPLIWSCRLDCVTFTGVSSDGSVPVTKSLTLWALPLFSDLRIAALVPQKGPVPPVEHIPLL